MLPASNFQGNLEIFGQNIYGWQQKFKARQEKVVKFFLRLLKTEVWIFRPEVRKLLNKTQIYFQGK